jgi:hypothetical protein
VNAECAVDDRQRIGGRPHLVGARGVMTPRLAAHEIGDVARRPNGRSGNDLLGAHSPEAPIERPCELDAGDNRVEIVARSIVPFFEIVEGDVGRIARIGAPQANRVVRVCLQDRPGEMVLLHGVG